jgi:hypothetical protein
VLCAPLPAGPAPGYTTKKATLKGEIAMRTKPNKRLDDLRSQAPLNQGETYVGGFLARSKMKTLWFFLIGPLAAFTMKQYQVMVTSERVFFGKLSLLGKLAHIDQFRFDEISSASFKKGVLTYKLKFKFRNGRSLELDANHKGWFPWRDSCLTSALNAI